MLGIKDVFKRNTLSFNFYFRKNVSSNYAFFSGVDGALIEQLLPILIFLVRIKKSLIYKNDANCFSMASFCFRGVSKTLIAQLIPILTFLDGFN